VNAAGVRGNQGNVDEFRIQRLWLWILGAVLLIAFVVYAFPALDAV